MARSSPGLRKIRDRHWEVLFDLGVDADGKRRRARRRFTATSQRDAERQAAKLREAMTAVAVEAHRTTFAQACESWYRLWLLADRSENTRHGYRRLLDTDIIPGPLGVKLVGDVKRGDVHRWYAALASEPRAKTGRPLSPKSVQRIQAIVRQVFATAMDDELIESNPAIEATKWIESEDEAPVRRPPLPVLRAVLAAAADSDPARARLAAFAARTGLRRGELAALRWSDVDLVGARMRVARAITLGRGTPRPLVEGRTKAKNIRFVILDEETLALLEVQQDWQQRNGRVGEDPRVWSVDTPYERPMHPDTLTNWWTEARKKAARWARDAGAEQAVVDAILSVRLHDCRHWQGSVQAAIIASVPGASLADLAQRLGHKQIQTSMRYMQRDDDEAIQRQMAALMPSLLELGPGH